MAWSASLPQETHAEDTKDQGTRGPPAAPERQGNERQGDERQGGAELCQPSSSSSNLSSKRRTHIDTSAGPHGPKHSSLSATTEGPTPRETVVSTKNLENSNQPREPSNLADPLHNTKLRGPVTTIHTKKEVQSGQAGNNPALRRRTAEQQKDDTIAVTSCKSDVKSSNQYGSLSVKVVKQSASLNKCIPPTDNTSSSPTPCTQNAPASRPQTTATSEQNSQTPRERLARKVSEPPATTVLIHPNAPKILGHWGSKAHSNPEVLSCTSQKEVPNQGKLTKGMNCEKAIDMGKRTRQTFIDFSAELSPIPNTKSKEQLETNNKAHCTRNRKISEKAMKSDRLLYERWRYVLDKNESVATSTDLHERAAVQSESMPRKHNLNSDKKTNDEKLCLKETRERTFLEGPRSSVQRPLHNLYTSTMAKATSLKLHKDILCQDKPQCNIDSSREPGEEPKVSDHQPGALAKQQHSNYPQTVSDSKPTSVITKGKVLSDDKFDCGRTAQQPRKPILDHSLSNKQISSNIEETKIKSVSKSKQQNKLKKTHSLGKHFEKIESDSAELTFIYNFEKDSSSTFQPKATRTVEMKNCSDVSEFTQNAPVSRKLLLDQSLSNKQITSNIEETTVSKSKQQNKLKKTQSDSKIESDSAELTFIYNFEKDSSSTFQPKATRTVEMKNCSDVSEFTQNAPVSRKLLLDQSLSNKQITSNIEETTVSKSKQQNKLKKTQSDSKIESDSAELTFIYNFEKDSSSTFQPKATRTVEMKNCFDVSEFTQNAPAPRKPLLDQSLSNKQITSNIEETTVSKSKQQNKLKKTHSQGKYFDKIESDSAELTFIYNLEKGSFSTFQPKATRTVETKNCFDVSEIPQNAPVPRKPLLDQSLSNKQITSNIEETTVSKSKQQNKLKKTHSQGKYFDKIESDSAELTFIYNLEKGSFSTFQPKATRTVETKNCFDVSEIPQNAPVPRKPLLDQSLSNKQITSNIEETTVSKSKQQNKLKKTQSDSKIESDSAELTFIYNLEKGSFSTFQPKATRTVETKNCSDVSEIPQNSPERPTEQNTDQCQHKRQPLNFEPQTAGFLPETYLKDNKISTCISDKSVGKPAIQDRCRSRTPVKDQTDRTSDSTMLLTKIPTDVSVGPKENTCNEEKAEKQTRKNLHPILAAEETKTLPPLEEISSGSTNGPISKGSSLEREETALNETPLKATTFNQSTPKEPTALDTGKGSEVSSHILHTLTAQCLDQPITPEWTTGEPGEDDQWRPKRRRKRKRKRKYILLYDSEDVQTVPRVAMDTCTEQIETSTESGQPSTEKQNDEPTQEEEPIKDYTTSNPKKETKKTVDVSPHIHSSLESKENGKASEGQRTSKMTKKAKHVGKDSSIDLRETMQVPLPKNICLEHMETSTKESKESNRKPHDTTTREQSLIGEDYASIVKAAHSTKNSFEQTKAVDESRPNTLDQSTPKKTVRKNAEQVSRSRVMPKGHGKVSAIEEPNGTGVENTQAGSRDKSTPAKQCMKHAGKMCSQNVLVQETTKLSRPKDTCLEQTPNKCEYVQDISTMRIQHDERDSCPDLRTVNMPLSREYCLTQSKTTKPESEELTQKPFDHGSPKKKVTKNATDASSSKLLLEGRVTVSKIDAPNETGSEDTKDRSHDQGTPIKRCVRPNENTCSPKISKGTTQLTHPKEKYVSSSRSLHRENEKVLLPKKGCGERNDTCKTESRQHKELILSKDMPKEHLKIDQHDSHMNLLSKYTHATCPAGTDASTCLPKIQNKKVLFTDLFKSPHLTRAQGNCNSNSLPPIHKDANLKRSPEKPSRKLSSESCEHTNDLTAVGAENKLGESPTEDGAMDTSRRLSSESGKHTGDLTAIGGEDRLGEDVDGNSEKMSMNAKQFLQAFQKENTPDTPDAKIKPSTTLPQLAVPPLDTTVGNEKNYLTKPEIQSDQATVSTRVHGFSCAEDNSTNVKISPIPRTVSPLVSPVPLRLEQGYNDQKENIGFTADNVRVLLRTTAENMLTAQELTIEEFAKSLDSEVVRIRSTNKRRRKKLKRQCGDKSPVEIVDIRKEAEIVLQEVRALRRAAARGVMTNILAVASEVNKHVLRKQPRTRSLISEFWT